MTSTDEPERNAGATSATPSESARNEPAKHRILNAVSGLADRCGVSPVVGRIYWELDRAYCSARIAMMGGETDARIAETAARFGLSTRWEYRRATDLGGERAVIESLLAELRGSETVWDIGACVGTYSCFAARALPTGRVVGFEPEPTNRSRLRANLERNAPTDSWTVAPFALSDESGACTLASEFVEAGAGHHYLAPDGRGPAVETRRGDELIEESGYPTPDVIKIDVQGAELPVLRGLSGVLEDARSIYLEVHSEKCRRYGTTAEEIESFLRTSGFSVASLGEPTNRRSGVYFVCASR